MKKFYACIRIAVPVCNGKKQIARGSRHLLSWIIAMLFALSATAQYCSIWYVQSGASGSGTPTSPASFATAIANVPTGGTILMEEGDYAFSSTITIPENVIIDGGYTVDAGFNWVKGTNTPTILNITPTLQSSSVAGTTVGYYIGITASGNGFELKDLTINVLTGGTSGTTSNLGNSIYGIYLNGQTGYLISRCAITTGSAATGVAGSTPGGTGGGYGGGGGGIGGDGWLNACAETSGTGSTGGTGSEVWAAEAGGSGGAGCGNSGCNSVGCNSNECNGSSGNAGTPGHAAPAYAGQPTPNNTTNGYLTFYVPVDGVQGYSGDGGAGGGGGGGGVSGTCCTCTCGSGVDYGGNGGNGGNGGEGGFGGYGGGGSFGIYVYGGSGTVTECSFSIGTGGTGGSGGAGQAGNTGQTGGGTNSVTGGCNDATGAGGGNGGNGGQGGTGQQGLTGPSTTIEALNGAAITQNAIGSVPTDGVTDANWGRGCTNSLDTLIKNTSDTWGNFIGTDAQFVDNLTSATSTYNSSSDTVVIYYPTTSATGDKVVIVGTTDLDNFIRLNNNRLVNPSNSFIAAITNPCPSQSINLANTLTVGEAADIIGYQWEVSDEASPSIIVYSFSTANPGAIGPPGTGWTPGHTYQVRFQTDETCCGWSIPMWASFTVNDTSVAPTAINATANPICDGSSTTLSITTGTLGTGATWQWYSGSCGGTTAGTGTTISPSPNATTTYYVQATGSSGCATTSCISITITVDTPTVVSGTPTATPSTICVGASSTLQYTSGSLGTGAHWAWYAGGCGSGTSIGTGSSIIVSPLASTTYYVRGEVSSSSACTYPTTCTSVTVTVDQNSTAATSINATSTSICSGSSTSLSAVGGSLGAGASWQWYTGSCGGTGIGGGSPISVSPTATTTYYLRAEGTCDTTSCDSITITVSQPSTAPGTITATPSPICNGQSSLLVITSGTLGTGASWNWYTGSCGGTQVGTGDSLIVNPGSSTTYYAWAEGPAPCLYPTACTDVSVVVNQPAAAPTGVVATVDTICNGSSTQLTVQGTLSAGATWEWYSGSCAGSSVGSGTTVTVSPTSTTTYYVNAVGPLPCSPSACDSIVITVNQASTAAGSVTVNPTSICLGQSSVLSANGGLLGTGASWVWYAGGCGTGSSVGTGDSLTVSPASTTTYFVRAEGPGPCPATTLCSSGTVTIAQASTAPTGISGTTSVCAGSSTSLTVTGGSLGTGDSWVWYSGSCGGTPVATGGTVSLSPAGNTSYYVRAEGPCDTTTCASIAVIVSLPSTVPTVSASPSAICNGDSSVLSITSGTLGTGATWVWYAGGCGTGGSVGNGTSLTVTPASTTTYFVRAEGSGPCTYPTACASITVTISQSSTAPTGISATSGSICSGSSTALTVQGGSLGAGASWEWYTDSCGGTPAGSGITLSVNPSDTTTYYVRAEGVCDTTSCVSITIDVSQPSTAPGTVTANPSPVCNGQSSILIVTSGTLGTGASWVWYTVSCGGTLAGTGDSLTVTPTSSTTYYVRAEGSGPCTYPTSCSNVVVAVNDPASPPTGVTATVDTICNGSSTQLTVQGTLSTGATWQWYSSSCGGTSVGSGSSVTVSPTATTTYYVRAEGPSPCPPTTCVSITITVNQPSQSAGSVTVNPTAICMGQSSILSANGGTLGTGASWVWYAGGCGTGGSIGTGDSITVSPTVNTTYFVHAEGPGPCPATTLCASGTVTIAQPSVAPTGINASASSICSGSSASLTVQGGSLGAGATWEWYSGSCGGTPVGSGSTISVSPTSNTTYYVRAEGACDTTTCDSISIIVSQPSTIGSAAASPSAICGGQSAIVYVSSGTLGTGATWTWYAGGCGTGGAIGTGDTITVTPASNTTYYVRAEGSGACPYPTVCASVSIAVTEASVAPTGINASSTTICSGSGASLTVQGGTLGAGATWEWYSGTCGGTPVGSGSTLNVNPAGTTTYYVRAESTCDTTTCASVTITVDTASVIGAASASPSFICSGQSTIIYVSSGTLGTGATWTWYTGGCGTGGAIGTGDSLSVTPASSTTYYVRAEGSGACTYPTICVSVAVTVSQASVAPTGINAGADTVCSGSGTSLSVQGGSLGAGATWEWYINSCGGTHVGSGSTLNISLNSTTTYYVRAEGACDTTSCASITITVDTPSVIGAASASPATVCSGQNTILYVSSGTLGTSATWTWYTGGCGSGSAIGTGDSITQTPSGNTTYFVRAEGSGACSYPTICVSVSVTVTQSSTAPTGISASSTSICNGSSTLLTVQGGSLGAGATWEWYSGTCGGTPVGSGSTLSVSPTDTTAYFVRAEGACDTTTCATITINVNQPSSISSATATPSVICGGQSTMLIATGTLGTGATWTWYAGGCGTGGAIGTGDTITQTPGASTTYFIRAEGGSPCPNTLCASVAVIVSQASVAPTGISAGATTTCSGSGTSLSVQGGSLGAGATWEWYSGTCGGTPVGSGTTINVNPTDSTTYFVRAESPCDSTSCASLLIAVSQPSVIGAASASPSNICGGQSAIVYVGSGTLGTGATWVWYAGGCGSGISVGSGDSITVNPTSNTTYFVRAEGSGVCSYPTICVSASVVVSQPSTAPTSIQATSNPVCSGTNTVLTVQGGTLGAGASWEWYSGSCGGTPVGSGSSVSVSPTVSTTYYVRAEGGCDTTTCAQLLINVNPSPNGFISGTTTLCSGSSTDIIFNFTAGTGPFNIDYTDGTNIYTLTGVDSGQVLSVSPTVTTTYRFTSITDANGCTSTSGFTGGATITVDQPPFINSVVAVNAGCAGASSGSITINASGGTPPLYYSIDTGDTYQTTNFFGGLAVDSYYVVVEDTLGCSRTYSFNPVVIGQSSPLSQTDSVAGASCTGVNNGQIFVTASGGVQPYHYALNGGAAQVGSEFTNLGPGSYVVEVIDANNCYDTNTVTIGSSYSISDSLLSQTNVSCFGQSNGAITVELIGGTPPYSYSINGTFFQSSPTFTGLSAGSLIVTLKDSLGCTDYLSVDITQGSQMIVSVDSVQNILCNGTSTGSIFLNVSGGNPPYTFTWTNGSQSQNDTDLTAGTYNVTVSDTSNCSAYASATISEPQELFVNIASATNVDCFGDSSGSVQLGISGGVSPYSFAWSNGATTQNVGNLGLGTYSVTVTDANHCSASATDTITQPSVLTSSVTGTDILCHGANTGTTTLTVNGGTLPYAFLWSNFQVAQNLTGLVAGTYYVIITDRNNCRNVDSITLTQPPVGITPVITPSSVLCTGTNTGAVNLSVTGGTPGYIYIWSTGATTQSISGLDTGTYYVTITDANLCTDVDSAHVGQNNALAVNATIVNVNCFGGTGGSIDARITGGVSPYSYTWSSAATSLDLTGLSAGTITITVTDANNCLVTAAFTVNQPPAITSSITGTNVTCHGEGNGTATLTVGGGTPPYGFLWNNFQITQNLTGLSGGLYTVIITDSFGCIKRDSILIFEPAALTLNATGVSISCSGTNTGAVNLTVSGGTPGYTYAWSTTATTQNISGLGIGTYYVTVTDTNHCSATDSAIVNQSGALAVNGTVTDVACYDSSTGAITASGSGGVPPYNYVWNTGATTQTITGLSAGNDSVTVTDGGTCSVTAVFTVSQAPQLVLTPTPVNVGCIGTTGGVDLAVTGGTPGYSFIWSTTATTQNITGVAIGTYYVTVTDHNNCSTTDSVTVIQGGALGISANITNVRCNGESNGAISLNITGGGAPYTFTWSTGATTENISGLGAGNDTVQVSDINGCSASATFTITEPAVLQATLTDTNVTCHGAANGSAAVTASGGTPGYTYLWSNFQVTQNVTGLSGGTYYVVVTDSKGCSNEDSVTITQPAVLTITPNVTNAACNGTPNGAISLTITGGTPGYSYLWNTTATTSSLNNLGAGTYSVTVTDTNSCTVVDSITIQFSGTLAISAAITNINCHGAADGIIDLTVTGGTGPYNYIWSNGATIENVNGLSAGTETVTVSDQNNCSITATYNITQPTPIVDSIVGTNVTCHGEANGTATLTVNGGTPQYTFLWSNFHASQNLTGLSGGTYYVVITDAAHCSHQDSVIITEPAAIALTPTAVSVLCTGTNTGAVNLTVSGGTPGYTYLWSTAATTQNISGVGVGTYYVTVTDTNHCTATDSATVTQSGALSVSANVVNIRCYGDSSGSITATASGGTGPYNYTWNTGSTSQTITGLSAGTDSITVTDANSCSVTAAFTVNQSPVLSSSIAGTNVTCHGEGNGTATLTVSGGTPPYGFLWNNFRITQNIAGLSGGLYTVIITDSLGCINRDTITILEPAAITITATGVSVSCSGTNTGGVNLTVDGGTPGYSYLWSTTATTQNITGLGIGTYYVTVTDTNLCSATDSATVTQSGALSVSGTVTNVSCYGGVNGAITANGSGGVPSYNYVWNTGATTQTITGLSAGTDSVTVTDAGTCSVTASFTVGQAAQLILTLTPISVGCVGNTGGVGLTVAGGTPGYSYLWSTTATTQNITSIPTGTYYVTVTDVNSCTATDSSTVTHGDNLSLNGTVANVTCNGEANGSISLNVTGGGLPYNFTWSTGATTQNLTGLGAGTDSVQVTDINGCSASASFAVTEPAALQTTVADTNVTCNGAANGSAAVMVTGGTPQYTFLWSNFQVTQSATGLRAGTYYVVVTDSKGCSSEDSVTITQPAVLTITPNVTNAACNGTPNGAISLTIAGGTPGYSYFWNNAATTSSLNNLGAGTYAVTVTDTNLCTASDSITIQFSGTLAISAFFTNVNCNGAADGIIDLTITGGTGPYNYIWSNGATTQNVSGLSAGTDSVTVTDQNSCSITASYTISQPAAIVDSIVGTNVTCHGEANGTATLTVSGGTPQYTFLWSNFQASQNLTGLSGGTYYVVITDAAHCSHQDSVIITEPAAIALTPTAVSVLCTGTNTGAVNLTVSGGTPGYTYLWSTTATTQNISSVGIGTYYVTVTDTNHCTATDSATVTQSGALSVSANVVNIRCYGDSSGSITATASGGTGPYNYTWNTGSTLQTITGLSAGTDSITVTDANSCSVTAAFTVTQSPVLSSSIAGMNVTCHGEGNGTATLTVSGGTPPYGFLWNDFRITQNIAGLSGGLYTVIITDSLGCINRDTITILEPAAITITATGISVTCSGTNTGGVNLTVSGGTPGYTYLWSTTATTQNVNSVGVGTYYVTVTDTNLCSATDSATVTQSGALSVSGTVTNVSCYGGVNGAITANGSGGVPSYNYVWNTGATTQTITGLSAGNDSVTVTDGGSCSVSTSFTVGQATALILNPTPVDVGCIGITGGVNLSVTGGTPGYSYLWSTTATTQNIAGISTGTYYVTVTDHNNCTASDSATVIQGGNLAIGGNVTNVRCNGEANGAITLNITGGQAPYSFTWNTGATTQNISGLSSGTDTVMVSDINGCSASASFTVAEPPVLQATLTDANVTCHGAANGSAAVTASGGTPGYTYLWSNFQVTQSITGLSGGTYFVVVTDSKGCSQEDSVAIIEPAALVITPNITNAACDGTPNGAISLTVTGGTPGYSYLWNTTATTSGINGVGAGVYVVTVTDTNLCTATDSITIQFSGTLSLSATITNVNCNGASNGIINLTVSGGTGPYNYIWSGGATTGNVNGLSAGTETVTVSDQNSCSITAAYNITQPTPIVDSIVGTNVTCHGEGNGTATLTVSGGTPQYSFLWSDFQASQNLTGLSGGTYYVVITDASLCSHRDSVIIFEPTAIIVVPTVTNASCSGTPTGSISLSVSGGTPGYNYLWNTAATTDSIDNLAAGIYAVTVTDANHCTVVDSNTIQYSGNMAVSAIDTNVSCHGAADGSIYLTVTGGTPPYGYNWSNLATTQNITGLSGGTYDVTVNDLFRCSISASYTISEPTAIVSSVTGTNLTCHGDANGTASVSVSGGNPPYSYLWSNFQITDSISGLSGGTYYVIITDAILCTHRDSIVIVEPAALSLTATPLSVLCSGTGTGGVNLRVSGGTPGYTYLWSTTATTQNITSVGVGTYYVTVTDTNNCIASDSATVTQSGALSVTATVTNTTCHGGNNGAITATASGGVLPYNYIWNTGATTQTITALSAGLDSITVTDAGSCSVTASFSVGQPLALSLTITPVNVSCSGSTGGVDLSVTGGTPNYNYLWSTTATSENITNVPTGTYYVTVTDQNNCTSIDSTIVSQTGSLALSGSVTNVRCNGESNGAINLNASGGAPPYSFTWSTGATTQNINGLSAGTDSVQVSDINGCSASATFTITEPAALQTSIADTNVTCHGAANGSAAVTASGGTPAYTFLWSNFQVSQSITGLNGGTYFVVVTDSKGCSNEDSVTITEPAVLTITPNITNAACNGTPNGAISLTIAGGTPGYSYLWNTTATTSSLSGLGAGSYVVTVTDTNLCTTSDSITIQFSGTLSLSAAINNVNCNGAADGIIDLTVTGGAAPYNYVWSGGATTENISGLTAGAETVTVSDQNSCSITATYNITQPTPIVDSIVGTNLTCHGEASGAATVSVTGGNAPYAYLWSNFQITPTLSGLSGGTYYVIITDSSLCNHRDSVIIFEPTAITLTVAPSSILCNGTSSGAASVTATGGTPGYTYLWSTTATTQSISNIGIGTYYVTVTDTNSCTATDSAVVTQSGALAVTGAVTPAGCGVSSGSVDLTVTGGVGPYSFIWSNAATTQNITGLTGGLSYEVSVSDNNGCSVTDSFTIGNSTTIVSSIVGTPVTCHGEANGTATLTVSGGTPQYTYLWNTFQTTQNLTGLSGGTYYVIITDANGCREEDSVTIAEPGALILSTVANNVLCNGDSSGSVNLTVSGGTPAFTFGWSNGNTTQNITGVPIGTYSVTVTDSNLCSASSSITLTQPAAMVLNGTVVNVSCAGGNDGSVAISVDGGVFPYSYSWSTGATTQNVNNLNGGIDSVTVTDANSCIITASFAVNAPLPLTSNVVGTNLTCNSVPTGAAILTVNGGTQPYGFLWSTFQSSQNLSGLSAGTYYVIITDARGCTHNDSVVLTQPAPFVFTNTITNVSCNGDSSGGANIGVTGGTPGYTYLWNTGSTTTGISNTPSGSYSVTITDVNSCTAADSVTIAQPAVLTASGVQQDAHCSGGADGTISLVVNGGTAPYSFNWSNGDSTQDVVGLVANTYQVTITDLHLCSATLSFNISQSTSMTVTDSSSNVTCYGYNNGSIALFVSGGTTPYSFFWSNLQVTQNLANLNGGTYYVIITDANGCEIRDSAAITEPTQILITYTDSNITCHNANNGSVAVTVTGGTPPYNYIWNDGNNQLMRDSLQGGTYAITVTDSSNCTASTSILVVNPPAIVGSLIVQNELCYQNALGNPDSTGLINLVIAGGTPGYVFNWNNGATTQNINSIPAGFYGVTVTDARGCQSSDTATVTTPSIFYVSGFELNVPCYGDTSGIIFTSAYGGTPPYYYTDIRNGMDTFGFTQNLANLPAGTYVIYVTDVHGCAAASSYVIYQPTLLTENMVGTDVKCFGAATGTAAVIPGGGTPPYSYLWSDFVIDSARTGLTAGKYIALLTDSNGCKAIDSIVITQPTAIGINSQVTNAICYNVPGGSISITDTGGTPAYTYQWSNADTSANADSLLAGAYTLTVTDQNSCTVTASYTITQPTQIFAELVSDMPKCFGSTNGSVSVIAADGTPPYRYLWNTTPAQTAASASDLAAGTYTVTVTDTNGCTVTAAQVLNQPDSIVAGTNVTSSKCFNTSSGFVIAQATGGSAPYVYEMNGFIQTNDTFTNLAHGDYTLLVTDVNGCDGEAHFTVGAPGQLSVSLSASEMVIVATEQTQLIATATDSNAAVTHYFWSPLIVDSADIFDFSGCPDTTDCSSPDVMPPVTTTFTVLVEDADSCFASDSILITVISQPVAFIPTAFTPNGDGLNDYFGFNILGAQSVEVSIFDRWGQRVFYNPAQLNGLSNTDGWNGTMNGKPAPVDTYVYQMKVTYFDNTTKTIAGTITIMR